MSKLLFVLALLLAPVFHAAAQVTVEVMLDENEFLRDESLILKVRIVNRSGQAIKVGETADWLTFRVQSQDDHAVERNGEVPVIGPFKIESSQAATKSVNLLPWFSVPQPGRYSVTATVKIPQWSDDFISAPKSFQIVTGARLWEQEFGVPRKEGLPEVRRYTLVRATGLKVTRLYLRVSDADDHHVFAVSSLGQAVSFGKPDNQVDGRSRLHLLYQTGPRIFAYAVFSPDGDWLVRQTHEYTDTRPVLRVDTAGKVLVVGGQRRFMPTDVPAFVLTNAAEATNIAPGAAISTNGPPPVQTPTKDGKPIQP